MPRRYTPSRMRAPKEIMPRISTEKMLRERLADMSMAHRQREHELMLQVSKLAKEVAQLRQQIGLLERGR